MMLTQNDSEDAGGSTARLYRIRYRSRIVSDTRTDAAPPPLFRIFERYVCRRSQAVSRTRRISQTSKYVLSFGTR